MATPRTYGEHCAVARALDVVGERWALLVVRELLLGPKRFTDLQAGLPKAKPSVLSQRLRELEAANVVRRRKLAPPAGASVYELTEDGRALEPIVIALGHWGRRVPARPGAVHGSDSLVLALKSRFDPAAARGLGGIYELRLATDRYEIEVVDGRITARRGEPEAPDAVVETDPDTLGAVLLGDRRLGAALDSGDIRVEGNRDLAARFLALYARAERVDAGALS
jgi:DNA-binding HxlR family transcriptional regulator/putative sterol carrier protein